MVALLHLTDWNFAIITSISCSGSERGKEHLSVIHAASWMMEGRCTINKYARGGITNINSCTPESVAVPSPKISTSFPTSSRGSTTALQYQGVYFNHSKRYRSGDALVRVFSGCLFLARACLMATIMSVDLMLALTCSVLARSCNISQIRAMHKRRLTRFEAYMKENGLTLPQTSMLSFLSRPDILIHPLSASTWSSVLDIRFRSFVLLHKHRNYNLLRILLQITETDYT
jgi:hypothetical protein